MLAIMIRSIYNMPYAGIQGEYEQKEGNFFLSLQVIAK
jgi:hypothetical protein